MKKTLVESLKKNVKKYANYVAMFGILMLMSGQPVLATDATGAITGKFQSLFDLIGVICQAAGGVIREMEDDITAAGFDLLKETVGIRDQKNFQHKIIPFYYGTVYVNRVSTAIDYIYQRGVLEVVDITVLTRRDCLIGSKPAVEAAM